MSTRFRDALLREWGEPAAPWPPELDRTLQALIAAAAAAHPELDVSGEALAAAIGGAIRGQDLGQALGEVRAADLALARACADADPRALAKFERAYGNLIELAVARVPNVGMDRDDFGQKVREKLFTAGAGRRPRIASYGGRGSLSAWVRVTAMRLALDLTRRRADPQHRVAEDGDLVDRIGGGVDPELALMRSQWGGELRELLAAAMRELAPRDRNLLRHHYLHGLSARKIAVMYGVHRATAFKWIEGARRQLSSRIGSLARDKLGVAEDEIRSVIALLGSRLDLSVRRLIGSRIEPEVD